jgi:hypothetical protein
MAWADLSMDLMIPIGVNETAWAAPDTSSITAARAARK